MTQHTGRAATVALVLTVLGKLLALACALVVAAAIVVVLIVPRAVQGEAMTVLTGSMEPAIPTGSVALVRPVDPRSLEVGDVVTYQVRPDEAVYVTHRLVRIRDRGPEPLYVLRGDANNVSDDPILGDRIRGEVWFHVPYLGAVRDALHGRGGMYLVLTLVLAWFALTQVAGGLRERREARRGRGAGPAEVVLDRTLALVRLDRRALRDRGETGAETAARLAGIVVTEDAATCTVLVPVTRADELETLRPLGVRLSPAGTSLGLPGAEPEAAAARPRQVQPA